MSRHHASDKSVSVYVIDAISGDVVTSTVHTNARGPVPVVLSENSVIYGYQAYGEDSYRRKALSALPMMYATAQRCPFYLVSGQGSSINCVTHNTFGTERECKVSA